MTMIMGIESSCDDSCVAIYDDQSGLIAEKRASQDLVHQPYGGVVPELASRDHLVKIPQLIGPCLDQANCQLSDLSAIAYTAGPGLMGALLCASSIAKSLAYTLGIPAIGIHHLEAHIMAAMMGNEDIQWPFLCLLISGGHTMFIEANALGDYILLGQTLDDAVGEAFDKVASSLGLAYPGGPALERLAHEADDVQMIPLPRSMTRSSADLAMSFSGLKTAVNQVIHQHPQRHESTFKANVATSFQSCVADILSWKLNRALTQKNYQHVVVAGGVASNQHIKKQLIHTAERHDCPITFPCLKHCTDNAAMVAYTGMAYYQQGSYGYHEVRSRWPIEQLKSLGV